MDVFNDTIKTSTTINPTASNPVTLTNFNKADQILVENEKPI
tara:strand:- start:623 stop:748 length:126 start_codon:yes stop_codon:yes gene_type:complete